MLLQVILSVSLWFYMATIKFKITYTLHICGLCCVSLDYAELKQEGQQALEELVLMKGTRTDPKEGDGKQRHNSKEVFGICPVSHFCYMYNLFCPHAQGNLSHPNYPYCNIFAIPLLQHHCLMLKNTPVLFSSGSAVIRTRSPLNLADMPAEGAPETARFSGGCHGTLE